MFENYFLEKYMCFLIQYKSLVGWNNLLQTEWIMTKNKQIKRGKVSFRVSFFCFEPTFTTRLSLIQLFNGSLWN